MDPLKRQVCLLGNVIKEDGIVPRFEKKFKGKKKWRLRAQSLFDGNDNSVWPEVFTEEVIQELKDTELSGFDPNYRLIPFVD